MKAPHLRNTADYIYLNVHELYLKHAVDFTTNTEVTLRVNKWLKNMVTEIYFEAKKWMYSPPKNEYNVLILQLF